LLDSVIEPLDEVDSLFVRNEGLGNEECAVNKESRTFSDFLGSSLPTTAPSMQIGEAVGGVVHDAQSSRGGSKSSDIFGRMAFDLAEAPPGSGSAMMQTGSRKWSAEKGSFGERPYFSFDEFKFLDEILTDSPVDLPMPAPVAPPSENSDAQDTALANKTPLSHLETPNVHLGAAPIHPRTMQVLAECRKDLTLRESSRDTADTQGEDEKGFSLDGGHSRSIDALVSPRRLERNSSQSGSGAGTGLGNNAMDRKVRSWLAVRKSREKKKVEAAKMESRFATLTIENQELKALRVELDKYTQILQYKLALAMAERERASS